MQFRNRPFVGYSPTFQGNKMVDARRLDVDISKLDCYDKPLSKHNDFALQMIFWFVAILFIGIIYFIESM